MKNILKKILSKKKTKNKKIKKVSKKVTKPKKIKNIKIIIEDGKKIETNSNQILEFTKEVKNMDNEEKFKIIESLWRIIYSNQEADIYETNLMRRLAGLLYIDSKTMGDIKSKIKDEYKQ